MRYSRFVQFVLAAAAAGLLTGSGLADGVITRDEMHPSIYEYQQPLYCRFFEITDDGTKVLLDDFILTWAELELIEQRAMVFRKDGKEYRVPSGSKYECVMLLGSKR